MNNVAIDYLNGKGYKIPNTNMYENIENWKNYYTNNLDYIDYRDNFGVSRKMYTTGIAKRIAEDWSSIIHTEQDEIVSNKRQNKKFIEDFVKGLDLENQLVEAIEESAWSGTVASIIRLDNVTLEKGVLVANENTKYDIITVNAEQIVPLKIVHNKITDVAIVSSETVEQKEIIYIELHELTNKGYKISNVYLDGESGAEIKKDGVIKEYYTNSNVPLFSILKTPIKNPLENNIGLGLSMYANAIDQIKALDIAYHNFVMDFYLGGKKIIYNDKLIKYVTKQVKQADGTYTTIDVPQYPSDIAKQQFMQVGDGITEEGKELIYEYNPALRVEENKAGIQFALDMLGFKCGLGTKYYEFNQSGIVTATQYTGDRQDLIKNANKYRNNLENYIEGIIKGALLLGKLVFKANVTEDCIVEVSNKDGILINDEEIKEQLRKELQMGLISKKTYLMKVNKWTEEEVEEELARIQEENSISEKEVKLEE